MRGWAYALALWLVPCFSAQADDLLAKQLFDRGVTAAAQERWHEAAKLFAESLHERDRPATRFNLILSYWELQEPLEVLRHALVFLSGPDSESQRDRRARAMDLVEQAKQQLTVLDISSLPERAELKVDGEAALVSAERAYVKPGPHHLEARLGPEAVEQVDVELVSGQIQPWPRPARREEFSGPGHSAQAAAPQLAVRAPAMQPLVRRSDEAWWRRPATAVAVGALGAALALSAAGCWWLSDHRAERIANAGQQGALEAGHLRAVARYTRVSDTVVALSISGGALMTTAVVVGRGLLERETLTGSIVSLAVGVAVLGLGSFWLIRTPSDVLDGTDIQRPSRQGGGLLLSVSLPFVAYGVASLVARKSAVQVALRFSSVGVTW